MHNFEASLAFHDRPAAQRRGGIGLFWKKLGCSWHPAMQFMAWGRPIDFKCKAQPMGSGRGFRGFRGFYLWILPSLGSMLNLGGAKHSLTLGVSWTRHGMWGHCLQRWIPMPESDDKTHGILCFTFQRQANEEVSIRLSSPVNTLRCNVISWTT